MKRFCTIFVLAAFASLITSSFAPANAQSRMAKTYEVPSPLKAVEQKAAPMQHGENPLDLISEGFEGVTFPPTGWTAVDILGTNQWVRTTGQAHSGSASALIDYQSTGGEDWLITPQFTVTSGDELSFWLKLHYVGYVDALDIRVSTTDNALPSFTTSILLLEDGAGYPTTTAWTQFTTSLSTYAGLPIYIAFKHYDSDGDGIYIDDVRIGAPAGPISDAAVMQVYTLGRLPIPYGVPHVVSANVSNTGTTTLTSLDVTLNVTGANAFTNMQTIASLAPGASTNVTFAAFTPTSAGTNSVAVSVPADGNNSNNVIAVAQTVNVNSYSYAYGSVPDGGVGFSGLTGDFVARFTTSSPTSIVQVKVNFTGSGQPFQLGIWDATGPSGTPGTNLFTSGTLTTAVGVSTVVVDPPVPISGSFFVGIKQTGTTNVAFSYQTESPIRVGTFYYTTPTGGTAWTDFAPSNSFRLMIEPVVTSPFPIINYTTLGNTYINGNRALNTVDITDPDGVAGGSLAPHVYWKVNSGTWNSASTTSGGSPYNFTIGTTGLLVGDVVSYFVIAQDNLGSVISNPDAGLVATNVNTITTYPTSPNTYTILPNPNYGGGGPTSGGYFFANSTPEGGGAPSQPVYAWIDPVTNGHTLAVPDDYDDGSLSVDIGFDFTYFGTTYVAGSANLNIFTNGFLTLGTPGSPYVYGITSIPSVSNPANLIAGCLVDLIFTDATAKIYYGGDADKFVVTYLHGYRYGSTTDYVTFQVIFFSSGNIKMQYNDAESVAPPTTFTSQGDIGIQNLVGNEGIQYCVDGAGGPMFGSPLALEYGQNEGGLPIQLAYLHAQMSTNGRSVLVNWGTLTEINNYGFWVEKRSDTESQYQSIQNSFTAGHGTTNEPQHYSFTDNNASSGIWYYRLKQQDLDATIHYTEGVRVEVLTDVKELAPKEFALLQNYPNPFNPSTEIKFSVEQNGLTTLKVFNVLGQEVATLFNDVAEAGQYYKVKLDANNFGSGMYFYKLESGQRKDIKKMLLLK